MDEGDAKALNALFDMQIANENYESAQKTFEKILKFSKKPDKEVTRILNKLAKKVKSAKGLEFCKNVMKYYSGELLDLKNGMLDLGFKGISVRAFDLSLEFFNLVLSVDAEEKNAYWGISLAKIHAKSEKDVLLCDTSLATVPEYTKYLTMVDEQRLEACMSLTMEQERAIAERKKKKVQREIDEKLEMKRREREEENARQARELAEKETAEKEKKAGKKRASLIGSIILMIIGMGGCGSCWAFDLDIEAEFRIILGAVGGFLLVISCIWMSFALADSNDVDLK